MDPCCRACPTQARSGSAPVEQAVFVNGSMALIRCSSHHDVSNIKGLSGLEQQDQEAWSAADLT